MKNRTGTILAIGFALAMACAPAASAQLAKSSRPLTAKEAKAELFGIDMTGFSITYGMQWRECIDPKGETLYETPNGVQKGRMWIEEETGAACFAYADSGYKDTGCFNVSRKGQGYQFEGQFDGGIFATTSVVRAVKSCKPADDLIG